VPVSKDNAKKVKNATNLHEEFKRGVVSKSRIATTLVCRVFGSYILLEF
jgi:hypothetical protein